MTLADNKVKFKRPQLPDYFKACRRFDTLPLSPKDE